MRPTEPNLPPPKGSEYRFLENQAAEAKAAMSRTLQDMKATVGKVTDLRPYVRPRPLVVGLTALAAGFVMGAVMGLLRRRVAKAPKGNARSNGRDAHALPDRDKAVPEKSFLFAIAGPLLVAIVQTMVKSSMAERVIPAVPRRDDGLSRNDSMGSCI